MEWLKMYWDSLVELTSEMAPYLLLGFLFAGLLHVYLPSSRMNKYFGGTGIRQIFNASLLGIPLPLRSCGVIPTGVSFFRNGASKSSSISFLISTPQTGVDSIMATWSLIGLPFAIVRPMVALFSGIFGGFLSSRMDNVQFDKTPVAAMQLKQLKGSRRIVRMLYYGFVEFMADIARWLVIGLLLAALISVLIPDGFFEQYVGNDFLGMIILLLVAIPLYVCATGSIPIVAVLIMKGISPGAALVFLMAGPATNIASLTVLAKVFGRKSVLAYLLAIIGSSLLFGWLIDSFLPREWFTSAIHHTGHANHIIPMWLGYASAVILTILIMYALVQRYIKPANRGEKITNKTGKDMNTFRVKVKGMTCNHCKMTVEKHLLALENVEDVRADLASGIVEITGILDEALIKKTVESTGYEYLGLA